MSVVHIMSVSQGVEPQDSATLLQLLSQSRHACQQSVKECQALRSTVRTLEHSLNSLRDERHSLRQELSEMGRTAQASAEESQTLRDDVAKHAAQLQRMASEHAARLVSMQSTHRAEVAALNRRIEQLQVQMALTQWQDQAEQRPLKWVRMSNLETHPVHTVRDLVLSDARREESLLQRASIPLPGSEATVASVLELDRLLEEPQTDEQRQSQDDGEWRSVCRRLHVVLSQRRALLHIQSTDTPVDFLLRSRSVLVADVCQLHADLARVNRNVLSMAEHCDATLRATGKLDVTDVTRHLDLLSGMLADVDAACYRTKHQCFSDVDWLIHAGTSGGGAGASTSQRHPTTSSRAAPSGALPDGGGRSSHGAVERSKNDDADVQRSATKGGSGSGESVAPTRRRKASPSIRF